VPLSFGRRGAPRSKGVRIFFTTDIHGSDRCFRKFLNAAGFYDARYLILGGDITGKSLLPIERTSRGWSATFNGRQYTDITAQERAELEKLIRDCGAYPVLGERDELMALHDERHRDEVFVNVVIDGITRWMELADAKLKGSGVRCFVTPGNDDFFELDPVIEASETVEFVEGRCVTLDEPFEMMTTGYSNPTPWHTPRELPEDQMFERIAAMAAQATSMESLIAVLHSPPSDTKLDQAPAIDGEFRLQTEAGGLKAMSVGSTAVRRFITECQPLLGLHGHVHESRDQEYLGRTLCVNPGSEYAEGVLSGCLLTVAPGKVVGHQLVSG
jgi:uncharacterized protein